LNDVLTGADWLDDPSLRALCALLDPDGSGDLARFVGGAVRDTLLGLPVKDIDVATVHAPEEVMARLQAAGVRCVPTGLAHGTVTAILDRGPVEITTLRRDLETDGRRATVAFGGDWREDAARRDFTMNALYAAPGTRTLFDYFDGRTDLAAGRVRFIGDPRARIAEDHLRILRYFRFLARFGHADARSADYDACVAMADTLKALSRERVADELMRLLGTVDPVPALRLMADGGIFRAIVPEIDPEGVQRVTALHQRLAAMGSEPDPLLRLIALAPQDAAVADRIASRLKMSNKARGRIVAALGEAQPGDARVLAYRIGLRGALDRIALGHALAPDAAHDLNDWDVPRLPVSGRDVIARGVTAGPLVARTLRSIEAAWIAAGFPGRSETLMLADQLVAGALRDSQKA
jgi:poly(A) polymerase